MTAPKRIQLRREKGWRKPPGAVVVARPSKWGNPSRVGTPVHRRSNYPVPGREWTEPMTAVDAVSFYQCDIRAGLPPFTVEDVQTELAGRDLACWCALDQPCHGSVLLELANGGAP